MDLKDFVKQTIVDLCSAVTEADKEVAALNGLVNPGTHSKSNDGQFINARTTLDFDVAVTASSGTTQGKSGGAKIWVLSAGIDQSAEQSSNVVSHIRFSVDVVLPMPEKQRDRVGLVRAPD